MNHSFFENIEADNEGKERLKKIASEYLELRDNLNLMAAAGVITLEEKHLAALAFIHYARNTLGLPLLSVEREKEFLSPDGK